MKTHLFWGITALILAGLTGVVINTADRRRYGAAMSEQADLFSSILVKAQHAEDKSLFMEKRLSELAVFIQSKTEDGKRRINSNAELSRNRHEKLQDVLSDLYQSGCFNPAAVMKDKLNTDFNRFQNAAREMETSHESYYKSYSETINALKKNIARLQNEVRANLKAYQAMLKEIRDFISMPVDLDFDPQPDIENLNKKIGDAENLLKKLSAMNKELNALKKGKNLPERNIDMAL